MHVLLRLLLYCRYFGPLFVGKWLSQQSRVLHVCSRPSASQNGAQETIRSDHRAIFFGDKAVLGLHTFLKVQLWILLFKNKNKQTILFFFFCLKEKTYGFSDWLFLFSFSLSLSFSFPELGSDFRRKSIKKKLRNFSSIFPLLQLILKFYWALSVQRKGLELNDKERQRTEEQQILCIMEASP